MTEITEEQMKWVIGTCNQIDPRTQMNMPTLDLWVKTLGRFTLAQVQEACNAFYARPWNSPMPKPVIDPANLRRDIRAEIERQEARAAALEAPQRKAIEAGARRERVRRMQTPKFQQEMTAAAIARLEEMERKSIINSGQQARLDHYRDTGQYKPPTDGPITTTAPRETGGLSREEEAA